MLGTDVYIIKRHLSVAFVTLRALPELPVLAERTVASAWSFRSSRYLYRPSGVIL